MHSIRSTDRCGGWRRWIRIRRIVRRSRSSSCPTPTRLPRRSEAWRRIEMAVDVMMPQMGESVVEGTVTKWLVKAGDSVQEDQPLCEISSPGTGVIARLVAAEGQTLPVGALLAVIETAGAGAGAAKPSPAPAPARAATAMAGAKAPAIAAQPVRPAATAQAPPAPSPRAAGAATAAADSAAADAAEAPARTAPALAPADRPAPKAPDGPPRRYSPVVLRMAEERGIDLSLVPGTGIGGRVSKRDIEHYLEALQRGQAPTAPHNGDGARPSDAGGGVNEAPGPPAPVAVIAPASLG